MSQRCPGAVFVGIAKRYGYQFIINTRGVATIVPKAPSEVYGILWKITRLDEQALDKYEGVNWSTYEKKVLDVKTSKGKSVQALTYIASNSTPGSPQDGYLEKIVASAEQHGLPDRYIEELRAWLKTGD